MPLVRGVHAGRERGPALRPRLRVPAARQPPGAARQPALADDAGPAQAARLVDLRHRRRARHAWSTGCEAKLQQTEPRRAARRGARRGLRGARRDGAKSGTETTTPTSRCPTADRAALEARDRRARRVSRSSPRRSRRTPRARRCSRRCAVALRQGRASSARAAEGDHLHRVAPHAGLPAARARRQPSWRDGIVLFNGIEHRRRSKAIYAALARAARRHRPRHRLADRRHALGARRLLPRRGPHHDRDRGGAPRASTSSSARWS